MSDTTLKLRVCRATIGYLHSFAGKDIAGVGWEQLRAVTAREVYADAHSWVSQEELQAIICHRGMMRFPALGRCITSPLPLRVETAVCSSTAYRDFLGEAMLFLVFLKVSSFS